MFNYGKWFHKVWVAFLFLNSLLWVAMQNVLFEASSSNPTAASMPDQSVVQIRDEQSLNMRLIGISLRMRRIASTMYHLEYVDTAGHTLWDQYLQPRMLNAMLQQVDVKLQLDGLFFNSTFPVEQVELHLQVSTEWMRWRGGGASASQPVARVESVIQSNQTGSIQSIMRPAGGGVRLAPRTIVRVAHRYNIQTNPKLITEQYSSVTYEQYIDEIWQNPQTANSSYGELESLQILEQAGFKVVCCDPQPPENFGISRSIRLNLNRRPDFGVENVVVDVYTPRVAKNTLADDQFEHIRTRIDEKVNKKCQSDRVLVNAYNYAMSDLDSLRTELNNYVTSSDSKFIENLQEVFLAKKLPDNTYYLESFTVEGEYLKPTNIIE